MFRGVSLRSRAEPSRTKTQNFSPAARANGTGATEEWLTGRGADVQELLDHGAKIIVLSRGMAECLQVPRETLDFLKTAGVAVHVLPTKEAAALYNKLAESEAVGGLFHTTC